MNLFKRNSKDLRRRVVSDGLLPILPRLWRFAYGLSKAPDIADDLLQETCLRALSKSDQFLPGSRLDSWTFTICRSIWLNDLRKSKVRTGNGVSPVEELDLKDSKPSVEMNIFTSEVVDHVLALPDAQCAAVLLVYVEGFSYRDAAGILGIPIGTVMSRLATARKNLAHLNEFERKTKSV